MTNYLPLKIDTSITESQDVTTQPNQQVTTVMSNGSVEMNGYSINNTGYTDNFGRIEYYYFDNRYQYKIQSAATVSTLANRQAILQNQKGGVFIADGFDDNSYNINEYQPIHWRGFETGKYSLTNN